jgi:hypothetical protein
MSPKQLHDFIQVIYSMRKHHTKVEYFSYSYFIFYNLSMARQQLNHKNNMRIK